MADDRAPEVEQVRDSAIDAVYEALTTQAGSSRTIRTRTLARHAVDGLIASGHLRLP